MADTIIYGSNTQPVPHDPMSQIVEFSAPTARVGILRYGHESGVGMRPAIFKRKAPAGRPSNPDENQAGNEAAHLGDVQYLTATPWVGVDASNVVIPPAKKNVRAEWPLVDFAPGSFGGMDPTLRLPTPSEFASCYLWFVGWTNQDPDNAPGCNNLIINLRKIRRDYADVDRNGKIRSMPSEIQIDYTQGLDRPLIGPPSSGPIFTEFFAFAAGDNTFQIDERGNALYGSGRLLAHRRQRVEGFANTPAFVHTLVYNFSKREITFNGIS